MPAVQGEAATQIAGIDCRDTARLHLRRPMPGDLAFMTRLFALPVITAHRPDPRPDTAEISAERLERDIRHWQEHGFGRWAVETCGELIGFGGVTHAKDRDALNLSYHLHPDSWGKGLATELVGAVLDVAFSLLMSERVVGLARPANPASCRVLEKTGFIFEQEIELHGASTRLYAISRPSFPE